MEKSKKKKTILMILSVFILIIAVTGVSIAFFNYTRTGNANRIQVGRIAFNSTQDGNIRLTNIFPVATSDISNTLEEGNNVTINITGDTTYSKGIEYLVTAEDVNITVNDKKIPLNLYITGTEDLGDEDEDYFTNRGKTTSLYKQLSGGVVVEGQYLLVGYIAPGQDGIDGSLNIKAFIDKDKIAITDTYDGTESDEYGTTSNWVNGRTVFTTSEWNSISNSGNELSFKIRVEANEGVWVDPYTTPNFMQYISYSRDSNIKEIRFIKETPLRMQRRYDEAEGVKVDLTYQETGKVLAWKEEIPVTPTGTNNELLNIKPKFLFNEEQEFDVEQIDNSGEYILYIASSGDTKIVNTGIGLGGFTGVERIVFENLDTSSLTSMSGMFYGLPNLRSIVGLNTLDTSNVESMSGMFSGCSSLTSINLSGMNASSVTNMGGMFYGCSSLTSVDLSGMGSNSLTTVGGIFNGCTNLTTINMSGFNFGQVTDLSKMFESLQNVEEINLNNAKTDHVTDMNNMFHDCGSLNNLNVIGINTSNVTKMNNIFGGCTSLTTLDLRSFDTSNLSANNDATNGAFGIFSSCPSLATIYVSNLWNLSNQPSSVQVFAYNTSLVGGNGTRFNSSKNTVTMAVIDNSEHEGYLTLAS